MPGAPGLAVFETWGFCLDSPTAGTQRTPYNVIFVFWVRMLDFSILLT
jgi:hypothetical protein